MNKLFVYGSLMFNEVWFRLLGCHHDSVGAVLQGYRRVKIHQQTYPGLKEDSESLVNGVLMFNLEPEEISLLDQFEGTDYQRVSVHVVTTDRQRHECDVYLIRPQYQHILSNQTWEPESFRKNYLEHFLTDYSNW